MVSIRIELIISFGLIVAYYIYLILSQISEIKTHKFTESLKIEENSEESSQSSSNFPNSEIIEAQETLNDHFQKREIAAIQEQIAQVENIITEPEISTTNTFSTPIEEEQLISEGERLYSEFNEELFDATPRTASETMVDLQNLMQTISSLESLDLTHYHPDEKKAYDMGVGMFYDSISQKLQKIIKEHEFKKMPFVQAEKLESYAFHKVKSLTHENFRETLKIMKEVYTIKEIILINENMILLNFSKEPITLSVPEKVVLFFLANNFPATFNKLLQFTQWKPHYLNEILEGMVSKNFIQIEENVITSPGLITQEELAELNDHFKKVEQKKKEKALEKAKLAEEKRKFEQSLKEKKKKQEEKRLKEQQEKLLQEARLKAQKEAQKARKTAEKQSEQEDMERLKKIKATPRPKIQTLPNKPEKTSLPKSIATPPEVNHDFDDKVQIIENVFAKFKPSTGGLIVFQALRYYSQQEGMQEMLDSEWTDLIQELKNRHIIIREIEQSGVQAFLFENLELSDECIKIIKQFILHGEMNYQEMEQALGWKTQQIEPFIKRLYEINLIKYNQREKFYFPGLFNTQ